MTNLNQHYSAHDIEQRLLTAIRSAGLNPEQKISPEELGALDHFHTGGLRASLELLELAKICADERVLDVGAGLAGCARLIADKTGCRIDCIEMSSDYCTGAALLNKLTGLEDRITMFEDSAIDMPFADNSYDAVWMQNVGMNIENKQKLYAEIFRVLKPGGRFAFQEMATGDMATTYFPLPWATSPEDSFLATSDVMLAELNACGFTLELFEDTSEAHLNMSNTATAPSTLSLGAYVDNLAQKASNAKRSLLEGQIRLVRGVFRKNI